jgi:hypothetical protein
MNPLRTATTLPSLAAAKSLLLGTDSAAPNASAPGALV